VVPLAEAFSEGEGPADLDAEHRGAVLVESKSR
jgi:hypothetical protein